MGIIISEAGVFHGEVINLRDVITFEGESVAELWQAFQDSIEDYLAFCVEQGEKWTIAELERQEIEAYLRHPVTADEFDIWENEQLR